MRKHLCLIVISLLGFLVTSAQDNPSALLEPITVENVTSIREVAVIDAEAGVVDIAFNADSTLMAYVTTTSLNLWDIPTQTSLWSVPIERGGVIAFSLDSASLAAQVNYKLNLWDVADSSKSIILSSENQPEIKGVTDVAFVENRNELVAIFSLGNGLGRWKSDTGKFVSEYTFGFNEYTRADYSILSPDGTLNVLARVTQSIELRNTTHGDIRNRIQVDELLGVAASDIRSIPLAISADNHTLLVTIEFPDASQSNRIIWLSSGGQLDQQIEQNHRMIRTGTFSPTGEITVLGNRDNGEIYLWDTDTAEEITTLTAHTDWVTGLVFSPDATLLASGGADGTVRLWGVPADS
jgi:WD40 repeat protein